MMRSQLVWLLKAVMKRPELMDKVAPAILTRFNEITLLDCNKLSARNSNGVAVGGNNYELWATIKGHTSYCLLSVPTGRNKPIGIYANTSRYQYDKIFLTTDSEDSRLLFLVGQLKIATRSLKADKFV